MTSALKQMYLGVAPTSKTTVYTVPAANLNGPSIVREIMVHNSHATATVTFSFFVKTYKFISETIKAGDSLYVGNDFHLVLNPGDIIAVQASTANALNVCISGTETYV